MNSGPVNTRPRRAKRKISPLDKEYDELMVFVKLKYGTPDCTADFFEKYPTQ
jgi:hypothetical protein